MSTRKTALGVVVGATVTVIGAVPTAALLPLVGLLVDRAIGSGLSPWLFVLPLLGWPAVGGGVAAAVRGGGRGVSIAGGGLAGALGCAALGAVAGAFLFVLLAGMTPSHAGTVPVAELSATSVGYGAGGGALVGVGLGAGGGIGAHYLRKGMSDSGADD
ncbi:hypothetical protein JCM30237_14920 [Halolamina litorea]|uniref:Uncharacterized protein n=1 Tax=Halolamina litorea TaxID=1515593 RepID=A0ABD6BNT5_9EURY|nr:hypothetical protein [Halolamina litorea]